MAIVILNAILVWSRKAGPRRRWQRSKRCRRPLPACCEAAACWPCHRPSWCRGRGDPGNRQLCPADVRLVESANLSIEEASLTGESVPVTKKAMAVLPLETGLGDRRNMAFMSTLITYGRGKAVVVGPDEDPDRADRGDAPDVRGGADAPTGQTEPAGRVLGIAALVVCGLVGLIGVVRDTQIEVLFSQGLSAYLGLEDTVTTLVDMFMVAVSLAIAAVPEGLPAVVTITLALGMQEMIRRHALIRRLPAVETLGSATTICSDKTGTLTQNAMTAVQMYVDRSLLTITGEGYKPKANSWTRTSRWAWRGTPA